jgi:FkbM family methyltransferase
MMPDTADRLESHVRLNQLSNVGVVRNALSDSAGQTVVATVQEGKYGQATIAADSARLPAESRVSVQTTTLDAIAAELKHVRLMKIDLEGAELAAFRGATLVLGRLSSVVYESWGWKRTDVDPVDDLLRKSGFRLRQLDGNNWLATRDL